MYCQIIKEIIIKLNNKQRVVHPKYLISTIPNELRIIIMIISKNIYHDFDTLNNDTLNHMIKCRDCSKDLLYTIR